MPNNGVKFSQFPSIATINNNDQIVGLYEGANARWSFSTVLSWFQAAVAGLFVPISRKINNKALSADITLAASDIGAVPTTSVGVASGVASLDSTGKVPSAQLPAIPNPSDATPQALGTAAAGSSTDYSRADHVHDKPSAADVGAIATSARGEANGVASLNSLGKVPASQLPAIPSAATEIPEMDSTTGYAGTSSKYAREDHEHPENHKKVNHTQIAPVETSNTASQAYAVGQYFVRITATAVGMEITYYCDLCRVTAAVSSGGTLTENTNYVVTTLSEELPYMQNTVLQSSGVTVVFARKTADITASNLISVFSRGNASENYHLIGMWISNKFITLSSAGGLSVTSSSTSALSVSVPAAASNVAMSSIGARLASITV